MTRSRHADLAERYFLEDLPGATQLGARLNGILLKIDAGEQVTALQRQFLATTGLHALNAMAAATISLGEFQEAAEKEQAARIEEASAKTLKDAAESAERTEARAAAVKATFAAMQKALARLTEDLTPESVEDKVSGAFGSHKGKAWELYVQRWNAKTEHRENGMLDVFFSYFSEIYDAMTKK